MDREKRHARRDANTSPSSKPAGRHPNAAPGQGVAALDLTSVELALLAKFNLEMAEAYDEAAEEPELRPETREAVVGSAVLRRERARLLHSEAQRLGAYAASVTGQPTQERRVRYGGPERRERERRVRERRRPQSLPLGALNHADRRIHPDRRGRERRGQGEHVRQ
jgi:hypothetical protein